MKNAARFGDVGACPVHGTAVILSGSARVLTNSFPMAAAGDDCMCKASVLGTVTGGSSTVLVQGLPCARVWPLSLSHGGPIVTGSTSVFVGGPTTNVSGRLANGRRLCEQLAAGRDGGSTQQSEANCGLESARSLINQQRSADGLPPLSEEELLQSGVNDPDVDVDDRAGHYGGITSADLAKLMAKKGVPNDYKPMTEDEMAAAIAAGKPVIAFTRPADFWPGCGADDRHFVTVTGVERDANGNITAFWINDTGQGICGLRVPVDAFRRARTNTEGGTYWTITPKHPPGAMP